MESNKFKMSYGDYEMTSVQVAEKLFLNEKSICSIEKRALEKIRKIMAEKGITAQDILS